MNIGRVENIKGRGGKYSAPTFNIFNRRCLFLSILGGAVKEIPDLCAEYRLLNNIQLK